MKSNNIIKEKFQVWKGWLLTFYADVLLIGMVSFKQAAFLFEWICSGTKSADDAIGS